MLRLFKFFSEFLVSFFILEGGLKVVVEEFRLSRFRDFLEDVRIKDFLEEDRNRDFFIGFRNKDFMEGIRSWSFCVKDCVLFDCN